MDPIARLLDNSEIAAKDIPQDGTLLTFRFSEDAAPFARKAFWGYVETGYKDGAHLLLLDILPEPSSVSPSTSFVSWLVKLTDPVLEKCSIRAATPRSKVVINFD